MGWETNEREKEREREKKQAETYFPAEWTGGQLWSWIRPIEPLWFAGWMHNAVSEKSLWTSITWPYLKCSLLSSAVYRAAKPVIALRYGTGSLPRSLSVCWNRCPVRQTSEFHSSFEMLMPNIITLNVLMPCSTGNSYHLYIKVA